MSIGDFQTWSMHSTLLVSFFNAQNLPPVTFIACFVCLFALDKLVSCHVKYSVMSCHGNRLDNTD